MGTNNGWPYCTVLQRECVAHEVANRIGSDLLSQLITFLHGSESGARLILQRNKNSFTLQITEAIHTGEGEMLGPDDIKQVIGHNGFGA